MITKNGTSIETLDDWKRLAGPKGTKQWKDYRSAKECARAWLGRDGTSGIPEEIERTLAGHPDFGAILEWEAEPERLVAIDGYRGPANVDVMLEARDAEGPFVVAIEAKVNESFGPTVADALAEAAERSIRNPRSKGIARIMELTSAIFEPARKSEPRLRKIRYQLLTLVAAALVRAAEVAADRAVVLVHEFWTPVTHRGSREGNDGELTALLWRLGRYEDLLDALFGQMIGPVAVPGGGRFADPAALYFVKVTREVESREGGAEGAT